MKGEAAAIAAGLIIPHGWHGAQLEGRTGARMIPTVGHARDALVFALRHIAEVEQRGRRVRRVFRGVDNRRAVELVRLALTGRDRRERISLLTWQIVRDLGNATPYTAPKAWWNAERWILANMRVGRRVDALRRGEV